VDRGGSGACSWVEHGGGAGPWAGSRCSACVVLVSRSYPVVGGAILVPSVPGGPGVPGFALMTRSAVPARLSSARGRELPGPSRSSPGEVVVPVRKDSRLTPRRGHRRLVRRELCKNKISIISESLAFFS
jgi:hypothetical protein